MFFIGCSKDNSDRVEKIPETPSLTQWKLSSIEVGDLDFGIVDFNKQKILTVHIINDGDEVVEGSPELSSRDFSLLFSSCENLLPQAKCYVKIGFNAKGKTDGSYVSNLVYGEHTNSISAQIDRSGQVSDSIFRSNNQPISEYNFGTIEYRHNLIKSFFIQNTGAIINNEVVSLTPGPFQKIYDRCSSRNLKPKESCLVKVLVSGQGQAGNISATLSYGSKTLNLATNVKTAEELAQENSEFVFVYQNQSSEAPISLQTLNLEEPKEYKFYVKNIGTSAGRINEFNLSSHFNIVYNNCQDQLIAPNQSCYLKAFLTPQNKGSFSTNILADVDYQLNSKPVQWTVRSPGEKIECTNQILNALLANITWDGSQYSPCLVESCVSTHHIFDNACESNVITCSVENGNGTKTWSGESQNYQECVVSSCESNRYAIVNNSCDYIEPIAQGNSHILNEDGILENQNLIFSSTNPASIEIVSNVSHGVLTRIGNNYSYTPNANYNGVDSFVYRINDGMVNSSEATVSFTVNPVNDIPVAIGSNNSANEDNILNIPLSGTDIDGDSLTYELVASSLNGSVVINGNIATYTPNLNFIGSDSFSFIAKDSTSQSVPAVVNITVLPVNDQPIANAQTIGIVEDTSRSFSLSGYDVEGSNLTYTITQMPSSGILSGTAPNLTYTPAYDFNGNVTMKFRVSDGTSLSDEVTVSLTNNLLSKDYINERIAVLETKYRNKGHNITLPRIASEPVTVANINSISSVINPLGLTETNSTLISGTELTTTAANSAFAKHNNIRLHCNSVSSCYSNKTAYNKAIYGTSVLTVQNNFLWDASNSRYLGTQCNAWYAPSEISWVDKILDSSKSNYINGTYYYNSGANAYVTVFNQVMPTCGTVYYSYSQGCRSYGYVYITVGSNQYPSSMGNGGCASGSGVATFSKGQSITIGSHYYASGTLRTGY